ncbi:hypothetical protein AB0383_49770 [Amycolatopsis sp. NPDC051373]|uniref:hypothetical protein n=1 Tax=Amycolatopsis sp. NPDC051373 TaxID=3155801 RepID=UPI00344B5B33
MTAPPDPEPHPWRDPKWRKAAERFRDSFSGSLNEPCSECGGSHVATPYLSTSGPLVVTVTPWHNETCSSYPYWNGYYEAYFQNIAEDLKQL